MAMYLKVPNVSGSVTTQNFKGWTLDIIFQKLRSFN